MKVVFSKHIHSGFASFQSGDKFAEVIVDSKSLDFPLPKKGERIKSDKFPQLNGYIVTEVTGDRQYKAFYFESDKRFYNKALHSGRGAFSNSFGDTPEFKEHLEEYKKAGWTFDEPIPEQDAYYVREAIRDEKKAKKAGLVLWRNYKERTPADYQGGFSDGVFNSPELKQYVSGGCAFGWIGHSVRRPQHDKLIEKGLRERGLSDAAMYNWISSGDGRHFGDSLEGYSLKEQLAKIESYLNSMFNCCLIYASSQHTGMAISTNEIRADYEEQGFLLPEDHSKYNPNEWLMLLAGVFVADKKLKGKKLSPSEELFTEEFRKTFHKAK